jgi:NitT/TauT family transport system ATP-binding protein
MDHLPPETITAPPLLSLRGVDKVYSSGTVALRGLDLDIGERQFVSLLGPSGCGKSTALRLIAGLGKHSAGSIDWPGHGFERGDLGFVFQEPTLMPWANVWDNVFLPLRLRDRHKAEVAAEVDAVLDLVGLGKFAKSYPRELSGGMRMRVSIARALVMKPRLLLMDEPFAALDEITRQRLCDDLLRIWQAASCTVVFVTHSVYESVYLSDRIVVMAARPGRIVGEIAIGEPYPRARSFRMTTGYAEYCRRVSELLDVAMAG